MLKAGASRRSSTRSNSASLRCGYIAAREDWIDALVDLKIATSFAGGHLAAAVLLRALTDSGYRRHVDALRVQLARAMDTTIARLGAVGIRPWLTPRAGMFVWCRLPRGVDAAVLARACLTDGVVLAPGLPATAQSLVTDPQTSGGLLVACTSDTVQQVLDTFAQEGFAHAAVVGRVEAGPAQLHVG